MNQVILEGEFDCRFGIRYTSAGHAMLNATCIEQVQVTNRLTGDIQERPRYHRLIAWRDRAEALALVPSGTPIRIEGKLTYNIWTNRNTGQRNVQAQVEVDRWTVLEVEAAVEVPPEHHHPLVDNDDIPF